MIRTIDEIIQFVVVDTFEKEAHKVIEAKSVSPNDKTNHINTLRLPNTPVPNKL